MKQLILALIATFILASCSTAIVREDSTVTYTLYGGFTMPQHALTIITIDGRDVRIDTAYGNGTITSSTGYTASAGAIAALNRAIDASAYPDLPERVPMPAQVSVADVGSANLTIRTAEAQSHTVIELNYEPQLPADLARIVGAIDAIVREAPEPKYEAELAYEPMQCETTPWQEWYAEGNNQYIVEPTEKQLITDFYATRSIDILSVEERAREGSVCEACGICPDSTFFVVRLAGEDAEALRSLGWGAVSDESEERRPIGSWTLTSAETSAGSIESATLTIDAQSIGGQGPCNVYGGSASFSDGSIAFSEIFSTLMYCEGASDEESAYFAALTAVDSYRIEGNELVLTGPGVVLRFAPLADAPDASTTIYFVPVPCEENPAWYPSNARDADRVIDHLSAQDITAEVTFVDRGAVCRACLETCAGSYLIAQASEDDVDMMLAQGWRSTHPFPDENSAPPAIEFSYYPVQCETAPWDGDEMIIDEDLIAMHYREQGLTVSNVERLELDLVTCEACYVCPSTTGYTLTLESGDPAVLTRDGWTGSPSCGETGCSEGRTCTAGVCVFDAP